MKKRQKIKWGLFFVISGIFLLQGCSSSRYVEPLEHGEHAISASIGGPIMDLGFPVVIPLTSLGYGYGIDTNLTVFGGIHTTALIFRNAQLDVGFTYRPLHPDSPWLPHLSVSPVANYVYDINDEKGLIWPQLDANLFWYYGRRQQHYFYTGINNWFELEQNRSDDRPSTETWIPSFQVGTVLRSCKFEFAFEGKWLAVGERVTYPLVEFMTVNGSGSAGFFFSAVKKF